MVNHLVETWLSTDFYRSTKNEAANFSDEEVKTHLEPKNRLEFGTAGLRGIMGAGYDRMNCLTVLQASQGLCVYLEDAYGKEAMAERGVVLGFDGRHNSRRFAHVAAAVFLSKGTKVYLIDKSPSVTPLNAYLVKHLHALCGAQMTASHNPKQYNGYKVYGVNGAQIVPPVDSEVESRIQSNMKPWQRALDLLDPECHLKNMSMTIDPYAEAVYAYTDQIWKELCRYPDLNTQCELHFVYTPMHGVGLPQAIGLLKKFGFPEKCFSVVSAQAHPDPEFPTVAYPNPEEKGALDMAMSQAQLERADYVLANDPDADRFTSCEKQEDGSWHRFGGDELGILFADWQIRMAKRRGVDTKNCLVVNSTVSSKMLKALADSYGAHFVDTLTGFKWLANLAMEMTDEDPELVYCNAYEESLGSGLTMTVPDKDGISACSVWCEMANYYRRDEGITLYKRLEQIRDKVGYFAQHNSFYVYNDPEVLVRMFDEYRNNGEYKRQLGSWKVVDVRDVTRGYDSRTEDKKSTLPVTPDEQMLTLYFDNSGVATIRASGTEPKVKYYCEISDRTSMKEAQKKLDDLVKTIVDFFLQPEKYGLTSR
ncbi:Phosphoglucomutase-2, putative [Perkinsus marinus ATCC 50983]|uniref:Phosphoglucomutase-2, putative n=1 Tax=Perkinsus marinus (strain ATCC 50983 / TXsc) TaxID=423536 RepID=C5KBX8_PERM5|nr:Phosphoglucomutase-2, putative [Perkinsus marinus ATCC 50983]EER18009.1 Phosphoglucomutase-2, putative [Perkinsus marinus ATCC 50983]|eukprot:XP_002786213.1 Phosphoglucomutase-2, putative [Perkinsus marinus ATCC 50983]